MPELPEVEAWRRALNDPVSAFPVEQAGPAHIATLKTFDPPLSALEGRRFAGAERRAKRLLFPTEDGELVLLVHLMSAGRIRYLLAGEKSPKTAAFRLGFEGGGRARADRGRPEEASRRLAAHARGGRSRARAPRPGGARPRRGAARRDPRRGAAPAALAPARPARRLRHRPRVGERDPAHGEALALRPGPESDARDRSRDSSAAIDSELERGLELRERGAKDAQVYRVHKKLHEPCHVCGTPIERVDFEEHTIFYCPQCQTERPAAEGPAAVASPALDQCCRSGCWSRSFWSAGAPPAR